MHSDHATTAYAGRLSDGRTAAARDATVSPDQSGLRIWGAGDAGDELWPYAELRSAVPLTRSSSEALLSRATAPGALYVADAAFAQLLRVRAAHLRASRERLRAAWPGLLAGVAVLVSLAVVWLWQLSPTKAAARMLPESAKAAMGRQLVEGIARDRRVCEQAAGRAALDRLVGRLSQGLPRPRRFEVTVLDWSLVNAFAVPGGRIILTRGLLQQAASADEVAGVLAHEVGHTLELHPEAGFIRGVGLWAIGQFLFSGSTGTLGNLGMVLAQLGYSREAEREADAIGLGILRKAQVSAAPLMQFFARAEGITPAAARGRLGRAWDILSSHPPGPERIEAISRLPAYAATPSLAEADWDALRGICLAPP